MIKYDVRINEEIVQAVSDDEDNFVYNLKKEEYEEKTKWLAETLYELVIANFKVKMLRREKAYRQAVKLLREQCRVKKDNKEIELKKPEEIKSSSMQNPADEDAAYRNKNGRKHWGYKAQALETCDPGNPFQVITDIRVEKNNKDDSEILKEQLKGMSDDIKPDVVIADGGLITEKVREDFGWGKDGANRNTRSGAGNNEGPCKNK